MVVLLAIFGVGAFSVLLYQVGFHATGMAALSLAAWIQSVVYGPFTSGIFSICQWLGAIGFGTLGQHLSGVLIPMATAALGYLQSLATLVIVLLGKATWIAIAAQAAFVFRSPMIAIVIIALIAIFFF